MSKLDEANAEKGTMKESSGFKDNWFKRLYYKWQMIWLVLWGKRILTVTYVDVVKDGKLEGTKAICKVSGMSYDAAITITDQFITNEKVVRTHHENLTLAGAIEAYGSMIRVVEDPKGGAKNYFDRVNMIAILNKKTFKTWAVVNKPNQVEQMMKFARTVKLSYA